MRLKKVGRIWHACYRDGDYRERMVTTGETDKDEAAKRCREMNLEKIESAAKAKIMSDKVIRALTQTPCLVSIAIDEWVQDSMFMGRAATSINSMSGIMKKWARDHGTADRHIGEVGIENISAFINTEEEIRKTARQFRKTCLSSLFTFCQRRGYTNENPTKLITINMRGKSHRLREPAMKSPVTYKEYRAIMREAEGFQKHAVALGYWLGLRLRDVCQLEPDCFGDGEIIVWTDKRDKRVAIPVNKRVTGSGELVKALSDLEVRPGQPLFPEMAEKILDPKRRNAISMRFINLFKRAGVQGKSFHCLRHAFVTRLATAGVTLEQIARVVGHSDTKTTEGYKHG